MVSGFIALRYAAFPFLCGFTTLVIFSFMSKNYVLSLLSWFVHKSWWVACFHDRSLSPRVQLNFVPLPPGTSRFLAAFFNPL